MAQTRSRFEKKIHEIRWAGARHSFSAIAASSVAQTMVTDGSKETILRIRGQLLCYADAASIPAKSCEIGIGALVVQAGSGTTVIQSPLTDPDAPWLFYERFMMGYEEMVTDVIDVPGITSFRKEIDNKAMRILRPGREVQLVMENQTQIAAMSVNLNFGMRILLGTA